MRIMLFLLCTALAFGEILKPIPQNVHYNHSRAQLGKKLFFDPGLSKDGTIACVTCHHLPGSGADNISFSFGIKNQKGDLNTPTVLNSSLSFVQTWSGKAKTLEQQVKFPITNPKEMGNTMQSVIVYLKSNPEYVKEFKKNYPLGINEQTLANALAEFEKALLTPDSKLDQYLSGKQNVLTPLEKKGMNLFRNIGCISCHNGVAVGGNMYQKFGIFFPYGSAKEKEGRFAVTGREKDLNVFKVPSLRNISQTAPYFHDGSAATLKDAIKSMGYFQLGLELNDENVEAIEAFLKTLDGKTPTILMEQ